MSKSNLNTLVRLGIACIYVRLSRDDDLEGESYSISNQKKLLLKIAKKKNLNYAFACRGSRLVRVTGIEPAA